MNNKQQTPDGGLLTDEEMSQAVERGEAFWVSPENSLRGVPSKDRFICVWEAIAKAQLAKAKPIYEKEIGGQTELIRAQIVNLNKKLDDREADLIEAKREERAYIKRIGAKWPSKTVAQIIGLIEVNEAVLKGEK